MCANPSRIVSYFGRQPSSVFAFAFDSGNRIDVMRARYFRMDVKDESTGAVTPWAVYVAHDFQAPNIAIGETYVVAGALSTDGTNRLSADLF